jgi:hypothetical protein
MHVMEPAASCKALTRTGALAAPAACGENGPARPPAPAYGEVSVCGHTPGGETLQEQEQVPRELRYHRLPGRLEG